MNITPLTLTFFDDYGRYFSLDALALDVSTPKMHWSGSLFALDLTQMYGTIQILFVFTFFIYDR